MRSNAIQFTMHDNPDETFVTWPGEGDIIDTALPVIEGVTDKKTQRVQVYLGDYFIGETEASKRGEFSFEITEPLPDGPHTVWVLATDKKDEKLDFSPIVEFTVTAGP